MTRAPIRLLAAVLVLTAIMLMSNRLHQIQVFRKHIHSSSSRLWHGKETITKTPHGAHQVPVLPFVGDAKVDMANRIFAPKPNAPDQIVVVGQTYKENASWVAQLENWRNAIYSVDNQTAALHTQANKGREANVYLTYLVDYYHDLPSTIVFLHPHEKGYPQAWHTDAQGYSNVNSLRALNIDFVQRNGYANLRCIPNPGCPDEIQPFREPYDEERTSEHAFPEAWRYIFENDEVPRISATPCCAQFAVSREQVLKRPLSFYMRAHQWLQSTPLDSDVSGRVFEYLWHIIFGQEAVYCPALEQCYKDVYNLG